MMAEMLIMHRKLGLLRAELNWIKCGDPYNTTRKYKNTHNDINSLNKQIKQIEINLDLILTDDEMEIFRGECASHAEEASEQQEILIEREYRPNDLGYNMKAIVVRTRKHIPEDILIGLSYGWKFMYPFVTDNNNLHKTLSQLSLCIDESIEPLTQHEAYLEISRVLGGIKRTTLDNTIQWLRFLSARTGSFFKGNKDIFATRSDKGAHTVIIDVEKYDEAIADLINNPCYLQIHEDPLRNLIKRETNIMNFFRTNHKTKNLIHGIYEPETKQLAQLYGLPKVHKETFCLRPITAMSESPGHMSGKVFDKILNNIFPRTHFHIKDSYEMKNFLDISLIDKDDILVSFDVVSMYTNIPRKLVKEIIINKQEEIFQKYGIGKRILNNIIDFLLEDSTCITALGKTYQQTEGLPMGGCISTTLARMTMDEIIERLLNKIPNISFIRVFVDDTIAAMKRELVPLALNILNSFHPNIKFTHELENDRHSINFLNITLIREGNLIITNWYRKYFASGRLLPYFSSHKRTTIMATAQTFLQTVLNLSDPFFFHINKSLVKRTLRNNGFPETTILMLMNKYYTYMKPTQKRNSNNITYRIFPHAICEVRRIKKILNRLKPNNVIFSDSTRNTKINWVTTRKTPIAIKKRGNVILQSTCLCREKMKFIHTNFNETGIIAAKRILTTHRKCSNNQHAFLKIKYHRGLQYRNQTKYLTRYIEWKHKTHSIPMNGIPNYHFAKALAKVHKKQQKRKQ